MNCLVCSGGHLGGGVLPGRELGGRGRAVEDHRASSQLPAFSMFPLCVSSPFPSRALLFSPVCALRSFLNCARLLLFHLCVGTRGVVVWVDSLRLHTHVCECDFKAGLAGMDFTAHTSWFWKKRGGQ